MPTTKSGVVHEAIRTSDGCIAVTLSPLRNSRGVPSQSPIRQTGVALLGSPVIVMVLSALVAPAATVTPRVSTASSFL